MLIEDEKTVRPETLPWLARFASLNTIKVRLSGRTWPALDLFQAVLYAAGHGRVDVIHLLFDHGAPANASVHVGDLEPVMLGAILNNVAVVEALLERGCEANPYAFPDGAFIHATDYAIAWGNVGMLQSMIQHGAKLVNESAPLNPLDLVEHFPHEEMRDYLYSLGSEVTCLETDPENLIKALDFLKAHVIDRDLRDVEKAMRIEKVIVAG